MAAWLERGPGGEAPAGKPGDRNPASRLADEHQVGAAASDEGFTARDGELLSRSIMLAARARAGGDQPFGGLVATADGRIVAEAGNGEVTTGDPTAHAEMLALRHAAAVLTAAQLAGATAYASTEPCPMCAAALYWAGVGRVVFALSGQQLYEQIGAMQGFQLHLGSRELFARGQRLTRVLGPAAAPDLRRAALAVHDGFWPAADY